MLITNIWNERDEIEKIFQRISKQTKKPVVWLWIDDGSTDDSGQVIRQLSESIPGVEIWLETMPEKKVGSLDTIGIAYNHILPKLRHSIDEKNIDYVSIMDVDNDPCPNYCARISHLLDINPKIGAAAGISIREAGKRRVGLPMGGGKFIRWRIMRQIQEYWDLAPDTLLNIKALSMGHSLKTWPVPMNADQLTTGFSKKGVFRLGRLNYYVGRPVWSVFFRALRRLVIREYGSEMLKGYFFERRKGTWRFYDPDVRSFYNRGNNPIAALFDILRFTGMNE